VAITDGSTVAPSRQRTARAVPVGYVNQMDWTPGIAPGWQAYEHLHASIFSWTTSPSVSKRTRWPKNFRHRDAADYWGASPLTTPTSTPKEDYYVLMLLSRWCLAIRRSTCPPAQAPAIEEFKDASAKPG